MKRSVAVLFALSTSLLPGLAAAQSMEQSAIRGVLGGLGIIGDDKPSIDYRERAPLVVPKSLDALPPPQQSAASRDPNWPLDPDAEKERRKAEASLLTGKIDTTDQRMTREQLRQGAMPGAGRPDYGKNNNPGFNRDGSVNMYDNPTNGGPSIGSRMGSTFSSITGKEDQSIAFTGEPKRSSLVEPPPGFRTPSADAPYGPTGKRVDEDLVLGKKRRSN